MVKINLPYLIDKNKLTQKEVSEATGIPKNTINRYYNGTWTTINKEHIEILCKFFNCKIEDLISFKTQDDFQHPYQTNLFDGNNSISTTINYESLKKYDTEQIKEISKIFYNDDKSKIKEDLNGTIKNYIHYMLMLKFQEINKEIEDNVNKLMDDEDLKL